MLRGGLCSEVSTRAAKSAGMGEVRVGLRVVARVKWRREGGYELLFRGAPEVGDSILLGEAGQEILTSAVRRIELAPGSGSTS